MEMRMCQRDDNPTKEYGVSIFINIAERSRLTNIVK